jgi:serine/threonine protein kinase
LREAAVVALLDHPNIVRVQQVRLWQGRPFLAMDYLSGRSLSDILDSQGKLPAAQAMEIFAPICQALQHAHEQGVVHRDIKPSNVVVLVDGTVKLVDFGIAAVLPESGKEFQKLTQTGVALGTVAYMSPEQCLGQPPDKRSDIYSLGCLMYKTLTGKLPFEGESAFELMANHLNAVAGERPELTGCMRDGVMCALAKNPDQRPSSPAQLLAIIRGQKPADKRKRQARRNIFLKAALPVSIVLAAAFAVAIFLLSSPRQPPPSAVQSDVLYRQFAYHDAAGFGNISMPGRIALERRVLEADAHDHLLQTYERAFVSYRLLESLEYNTRDRSEEVIALSAQAMADLIACKRYEPMDEICVRYQCAALALHRAHEAIPVVERWMALPPAAHVRTRRNLAALARLYIQDRQLDKAEQLLSKLSAGARDDSTVWALFEPAQKELAEARRLKR